MQDNDKKMDADWFRLRKESNSTRNSGRTPDEQLVGKFPSAMQPIQQPPNHDGMDLRQLPPMREAFLNAESVRDLFNDVSKFGDDVSLMQKLKGTTVDGQPQAMTADRLLAACAALVAGDVGRLQLRYRWRGSLWIDTLSRKENGFHLIRIAHFGRQ